jgi:F-type H+-transporting ATPase subunit delta
MITSKYAKRGAKELFRTCVINGLLDEDRVRHAVRLVLNARPRGYSAILAHFQRLVKLDLDRRTGKVESAAPLPASLQAGIQAGLTRLYGAGLELSFARNPTLLGGLRIKVGSDVYDGSVKARLDALEYSF